MILPGHLAKFAARVGSSQTADEQGSETIAPRWRKGCRACGGRTCPMQRGRELERVLFVVRQRPTTCRCLNSQTPKRALERHRPQRDRKRLAWHRSLVIDRTASPESIIGPTHRVRRAGSLRCGPGFANQQGSAEGLARRLLPAGIGPPGAWLAAS